MLETSKKIYENENIDICNDNNLFNKPTLKKENKISEILVKEEEESQENKKKKYKKKILPKYIQNEEDKHYYYIDNNHNEWQFLEINGTQYNYYFKCSTRNCKGFGMISRINKLKIFNITKQHNIPYYNHSYYKKNIYIKKLTNYNFSKEEWNEVSIRNSLFKWYFLNNLESTEENCKLYFKQYLKDIFIVSDSKTMKLKKVKIQLYIQIDVFHQ